ncbi:MAG: GNAT family N-acetyltransferase [Stappiaceae bacterium]
MIRTARTDDVPAIQACAELAYEKYTARIGQAPAPMIADFAAQVRLRQTRVIEGENARLLGFIVFYPRGEHMHLENVAILPECAGQGLGRRLISYCEETARALGLNSIELYTNARMTENLRLYPTLGYVETDRRLEDGFDRVFFRKLLTD